MRIQRFPILLLPLVAACTDLGTGSPPAASAAIHVINGTADTVTVFLNGVVVVTKLGQATLAGAINVQAGQYVVAIQRNGLPSFLRTISLEDGGALTVVGLDSAGGVTSAVLTDTNAIVPAGASKLRVAHMASLSGPISIWRTQPDFATPTRVQFPFPYRVVSPYLQSTPGDWRVLVSSEDNTAGSVPMPDTLANSGLISVGGGTSRTVVVVDAPGGGYGILVVDP
jgi:hypothetical protein